MEQVLENRTVDRQMTMKLAGQASTQSRSRRPLPPGAVSAVTLGVNGAYEDIEFTLSSGSKHTQRYLSWVGGQSGLLFGGVENGYLFDSLSEIPTSHGSYGHAAEHALADALGTVYDGLLSSNDMACRFFSNGSDATAAAARIARAVTGRDVIATSGYHGAHLDFVHKPAVGGVPEVVWERRSRWEHDMPDALHARFEFGELPIDYPGSEYPAILMIEVPALDDDAEVRRILKMYREWCDEHGAVFVIDDVVLGFRISLGGSAEYYGVKPDIVTLGKAMSATGCVSAIVGREDLVGMLDKEVFYSMTFNGAPGPVSVANATVRWLTENQHDVYGGTFHRGTDAGRLEPVHTDGHLRRIGRALRDGLNEVLPVGARAVGQPERFIVEFSNIIKRDGSQSPDLYMDPWEWGDKTMYGEDRRREWCGQMIERGIMCDRPYYSTMVHTMDDVECTLDAARQITEEN